MAAESGKATNCLRGMHRHFVNDPEAVRRVLVQTQAWMVAVGVPSPLRGQAEMVLAEVLNNIVEHAYDGGSGPIDLRLRPCSGGLICLVSDQGLPMPGSALPSGDCPSVETSLQDLPEGGFGWYLIRLLARDLRYRRFAGRNRLGFVLEADNGG